MITPAAYYDAKATSCHNKIQNKVFMSNRNEKWLSKFLRPSCFKYTALVHLLTWLNNLSVFGCKHPRSIKAQGVYTACTTTLCSQLNHTVSLLSKFWTTPPTMLSNLAMNSTTRWIHLQQAVTLSVVPLLLWASHLTWLLFHHKVLSHTWRTNIIPMTTLMGPPLVGLPLWMKVVSSNKCLEFWSFSCWGLNLISTTAAVR